MGSSTSQPRSFRMDLKGPSQRGTLSFTTKPPPSPARTCRTWVGDATRKVSTLDLAPHTTFTLITGIAGEAWAAAAKKISDELGVPVNTVIIGPGREVTDIYYDRERIREIGEDGALLARPDKHIGWRSTTLPRHPAQALRQALTHSLSR